MPHQLFAAGLQARRIYPELKKYFYKENSNVTWEEFLTTKFALWIDTRSSTDNTLHGSGRAAEKSGIYYFRLKKYLRPVMVILHTTCLTLKMQWHLLTLPISAVFQPLKSKAKLGFEDQQNKHFLCLYHVIL